MFNALLDWLQAHEGFAIGIAAGSLVISICGILITPWLVARIPADYFVGNRPHAWGWSEHHPVVRVALHIVKNLLGALFIVLGVALSLPAVPGPGIITLILGLMLVDLPGKRRAEQWIVSRPPIFRGINHLRAKMGQAPLLPPAESANHPP